METRNQENLEKIFEGQKEGEKSEINFEQFKSEEMKKIEMSFLETCEKESEVIKKHYPEAFNQLEAAAINNDFKKVLIDKTSGVNSIYVKTEVTKDIVFYPYEYFMNHKILMEEYDEEFSRNGAEIILRHEKTHFEKQPSNVRKKRDKAIESLTSDKKLQESFTRSARELGLYSDEAFKKLKDWFYLWEEMQTDINAYTKNFENIERFKNDYATQRVYNQFLQDGEKSLINNYCYSFESRFIPEKILTDIYEKEKEIKKSLIDNYNKRQVNSNTDK